MKQTIAKLQRRQYRYKAMPPSPPWWSLALITINLIVIAFFLLDAPIGSYATHSSYGLRPVGETITDLGKSGWILFASAIVFVEALAVMRLTSSVKAKFQAMFISHIAIYVFLSIAGSGLLANLIKRAIGRARPQLYEAQGILGHIPFAGSAKFESFPSGHSTTVAALLMAMALLAPPYRMLFLIMGLWLGFSRVIVAAHYPSDVIAGLSLGAWFSVITAIAFSRYGLLFRQEPNGWPVLRRPVPLTIWPGRAQTAYTPQGCTSKAVEEMEARQEH